MKKIKVELIEPRKETSEMWFPKVAKYWADLYEREALVAEEEDNEEAYYYYMHKKEEVEAFC